MNEGTDGLGGLTDEEVKDYYNLTDDAIRKLKGSGLAVEPDQAPSTKAFVDDDGVQWTAIPDPDAYLMVRRRDLPVGPLTMMDQVTWHPIDKPPLKSGWYLVFWKPPFDDHKGSVHCLKWEAEREIWPSAGLSESETNLTHWAHRPPGPGTHKTEVFEEPVNRYKTLKVDEDVRQRAGMPLVSLGTWLIFDSLTSMWHHGPGMTQHEAEDKASLLERETQ